MVFAHYLEHNTSKERFGSLRKFVVAARLTYNEKIHFTGAAIGKNHAIPPAVGHANKTYRRPLGAIFSRLNLKFI
jgi:hypothetical protein